MSEEAQQHPIIIPNAHNNKHHAKLLRNSVARLNIFDGTIRAGKTSDAIILFIYYSLKNPKLPGLYVICGKTLDTIERNILIPLQHWLPSPIFTYSKAIRQATLRDSNYEIKIFLIGANDEKSASKVRGSTLAVVLADEVTQMPARFFIEGLDRGLTLDESRLFGTTNPDTPRHWLKTEYIDRRNELDIYYAHCTMNNNPYISKPIIKKLEQNFRGLWYERFILGKWVSPSGSIYGDSFNINRHVIDFNLITVPIIEYYVSIDYGVRNPCVFLFFGKTKNNVCYLIDEYYWDSSQSECGYQKGVNQYLTDLKEFINKNLPVGAKLKKIIVDPSAADFILLINRDSQLQALATEAKQTVVGRAKNAVLYGIQLVIDRFINSQFFINKTATHTIDEHVGYVWDEKSLEDKPRKEHDHACDAVRYFFSTIYRRGKQGKILMRLRDGW